MPTVNDNIWHALDLDRVCQMGGELYTPDQYGAFVCKVLGLHPAHPPSLVLWRVNRKYVLAVRAPHPVAFIHLWKRALYRGTPADTRAQSIPLIHDEHQMELTLMCLFLLEVADRTPDPLGKNWYKE